jgi:spore coat protein Z
MCNNENENGNCICEILKVILVLQENACPDNCLDSCDRPMLGGGANCLICNTRPVMLYTCGSNSEALSMPVSKDITTCTEATDCSNIFRVEKLDGCCCTLRVLQPNPDTTSLNPYVGTNSFFTINTNCLCCIRCLNDTYIDCV